MSNSFPIPSPPPELVEQWADMLSSHSDHVVFSLAAQWGADQELEACCEILSQESVRDGKHAATDLRIIRRPKPSSLKEQALEALEHILHNSSTELGAETIRRALEALND